jgi:hypothetical protein
MNQPVQNTIRRTIPFVANCRRLREEVSLNSNAFDAAERCLPNTRFAIQELAGDEVGG